MNVEKEFIAACERNDEVDAEWHFQKLVEWNETDWFDQLFIAACSQGQLGVMKFIYSRMKPTDETLDVAFANCCHNGHHEAVRWMVQNANPDSRLNFRLDGKGRMWPTYN